MFVCLLPKFCAGGRLDMRSKRHVAISPSSEGWLAREPSELTLAEPAKSGVVLLWPQLPVDRLSQGCVAGPLRRLLGLSG